MTVLRSFSKHLHELLFKVSFAWLLQYALFHYAAIHILNLFAFVHPYVLTLNLSSSSAQCFSDLGLALILPLCMEIMWSIRITNLSVCALVRLPSKMCLQTFAIMYSEKVSPPPVGFGNCFSIVLAYWMWCRSSIISCSLG
jgi:hypothetical protein